MTSGLESYRLRPLTSQERQGWVNWSLDFFGDPRTPQVPYVDLTLMLDVTHAWPSHDACRWVGSSWFSWLTWSLLQTLARHPGFRMRQLDGDRWVVPSTSWRWCCPMGLAAVGTAMPAAR